MVDGSRRGYPYADLLIRALLLAALLAWLLTGRTPISAEVSTGASIDLYNSFLLSDEDAAAAGLAVAELELSATDSREVRSRFVLRSTLFEEDGASGALIEVPRAEIRWRLLVGEEYDLRVTAGRTRLSWGDGVLYNAGDVINGARPEDLDLTADVLRDETQWLTALYLPLGHFAFFEPVVLLPMYDPAISTSEEEDEDDEAEALAAWRTSAGGRVQFEILGIKTETGYLYRGADEAHTPYLSLQGNLWVDIYGGISLELVPDSSDAETGDDILLSGGALHTGNHPRLGGWTARAEALWSDRDRRFELYPELTWAPSQLFSLFARSQMILFEEEWVDTESFESTTSLGLTWTPTTGLSVSLYGTQASGGAGGAPVAGLTTITAALGYVF